VRGLLPETDHPVRNLATAPNSPRIPVSECLVQVVLFAWASTAAHQVSLADEQGRFIWTGRRFHTTPQDLARLWNMLPDGTDPAEVLVVMEPTRNAWVPLAAWFRRRGADVVLVPPERSADLAATTPSTPNPTGWTPSCWPGCDVAS
jgi:hypothetical protein